MSITVIDDKCLRSMFNEEAIQYITTTAMVNNIKLRRQKCSPTPKSYWEEHKRLQEVVVQNQQNLHAYNCLVKYDADTSVTLDIESYKRNHVFQDIKNKTIAQMEKSLKYAIDSFEDFNKMRPTSE